MLSNIYERLFHFFKVKIKLKEYYIVMCENEIECKHQWPYKCDILECGHAHMVTYCFLNITPEL